MTQLINYHDHDKGLLATLHLWVPSLPLIKKIIYHKEIVMMLSTRRDICK